MECSHCTRPYEEDSSQYHQDLSYYDNIRTNSSLPSTALWMSQIPHLRSTLELSWHGPRLPVSLPHS
ncbi:hypothetical protein OXYTRIMIC_458 [Oxytricha trifallax]|uniref:Uncharacterized protein n=1 Tax=Oxytricha trifallax TaxID=1172189 RepID=A0A073I079_9SPIT|nr:hypothetical protein OXYTRIMIC_458 [Oxytricha trifallax]